VAPLALVPTPAAAGNCPPPLALHPIAAMAHEMGETGDHRHVGRRLEAVDRNDNGLSCVAHVTPDGDIHVHFDDVLD
jgi:hypothetical protein